MADAKHDNNRIPALLGVSYIDGLTPTVVYANPVNGALFVQPIGTLVSSGFFGQAKIAVTATAVQLPSNVLTNGVIISAFSTNTAPITIGGSTVTNTANGTGNGTILEAGASISFAITNTNALYINGTANDFVSFAGS